MAIVFPVNVPRTRDVTEIERFLREVAFRLSYLTYTGSPSGNLEPRYIYDQCLDTVGGDWYMATGLTTSDWEQITFAAGTVGDHGTLIGLSDDDHTQYIKEKASGGLAAEVPTHTHADADNAGTVDHGALTGKSDDDHTQYLLADGTRGLSADWDAGSHEIRAETLESDVGTGTAPLTIASTTLVSNLNADLLDGNEAAAFAVAAKGVTNGDTHDHAGGDGAQIDHGGLGGLADNDHTQYILHSLATAASDFLVASGVGAFVKKTLAEVKTILGLGSAAYTDSGDYAVAAKGVTNGDAHNHAGGDGAQIDHGGLSGLADDDHTQYTKHALATAASDFLVASGAGAFVKKTLAETKAILSLPCLVDRGDPAGYDYATASFTTDGAWHDLDLSAILPAGTVAALIKVRITDDATDQYFQFRKNGNSNIYHAPLIRTQAANVSIESELIVFPDSSRVVEYRASNTTFTSIFVLVSGWWL